MIRKYALAFVAALCVALSTTAQDPPKPVPSVTVEVDKPAAAAPAPVGLTLTPDQKVDWNEGYVDVKATCAGPVEWLVLCTTEKVKYKVSAADKEITISVPKAECVITVFAVALDGQNKLTPFARCDITVTAPVQEEAVQLLPAGTKLYIVMVEDPTKRTPASAAVIDSAALRQTLQQAGHSVFVYATNDPKYLANTKLVEAVKSVGTLPVLVILKPNGNGTISKATAPKALPNTPAEVLANINALFAK